MANGKSDKQLYTFSVSSQISGDEIYDANLLRSVVEHKEEENLIAES